MSYIKNLVYVSILSIVGVVLAVNNVVLCADFTLPQLARTSVENYLTGKTIDINKYQIAGFGGGKVVGVFVTILDPENKSRGCWGDLYPASNIKEAVFNAALGAVKRDYRFDPPSKSELENMKFQVSLVYNVIPVNSVASVNPFKDGLLVQSGAKGGIIMPGEAVDAHYQMVQCKLKANIQPGEPYNLFKLVTKVYKEE
ncbi:MAG: AMMECR1 domain-containing protein [Vampirovibrionia bacterium]